MGKKKSKNKKTVINKHSTNGRHRYYKIIVTTHKKNMLSVYTTPNKLIAVESFEAILKHNKSTVRFPRQYVVKGGKLSLSDYELVLLENLPLEEREGGDTTSMLRNEFGKVVPHKTDSDKVRIYRNETFLIEETFWVYGYNPTTQRKEFNFILDEILLRGLMNVNYPMKSVIIYKNKLIIDDEKDIDIIICKNVEDSYRLANELREEIKKRKLKSVLFMGDVKGVNKKSVEEKILNKTNWSLRKIRRNTTRP